MSSPSVIVTLLGLAFFQTSLVQGLPGVVSPGTPAATLFQNVRVFDGKSSTASGPVHVLVRGRTIDRISPTPPIGTDILFSQALARRQGAQLAKLTRWYTPAELLKMATSANADLLGLSGLRNPYPGKLGVVEEGALADLLLVDDNPLDDVNLIANPGRNFLVIMKDGKIYKNLLPRPAGAPVAG